MLEARKDFNRQKEVGMRKFYKGKKKQVGYCKGALLYGMVGVSLADNELVRIRRFLIDWFKNPFLIELKLEFSLDLVM